LTDVETVSEVIEEDGWQAFGEDVCNLVPRWYMKDPNVSPSYLFTDKVNVQLNVFCALVFNRIRREVNGTDIVTIYECSMSWGMM
jgi:hypothetical protein